MVAMQIEADMQAQGYQTNKVKGSDVYDFIKDTHPNTSVTRSIVANTEYEGYYHLLGDIADYKGAPLLPWTRSSTLAHSDCR